MVQQPNEEARACTTCGAAMAPDQDWCLACGAAAPGRLGGRPGWRAAGTVAGLTVALVCGAVAASYAALSDDATRQAGQSTAAAGTPLPGQVAQVPPAAGTTTTPDGAAPGAVTTTPTVPTTASTPTIPTTASTPTIPKLPSTGSSPSSGSAPSPSIPPVPSTPTKTQTTTTPTTRTTTTTPTTTTGTKSGDGDSSTRPELTNITLGADALSLYDPYGRATDKGDPADAQDDRDDTAWFVTTPDDKKGMQAGLLVDLDAVKLVRAVTIKTSTPGFRLELYGADTSTLPPDILDTRWSHIGSRSDVDQNSKGTNVPGDGEERIVLPKDGDRFRYVLLWFTTPPDTGTTVKLGEVNLLG